MPDNLTRYRQSPQWMTLNSQKISIIRSRKCRYHTWWLSCNKLMPQPVGNSIITRTTPTRIARWRGSNIRITARTTMIRILHRICIITNGCWHPKGELPTEPIKKYLSNQWPPLLNLMLDRALPPLRAKPSTTHNKCALRAVQTPSCRRGRLRIGAASRRAGSAFPKFSAAATTIASPIRGNQEITCRAQWRSSEADMQGMHLATLCRTKKLKPMQTH